MLKNNTKKLGNKGETLAAKFLINNGYEIIDRNYRRSTGEIDLIAFKKGILHFFEVKSVSRETFELNFNNVHRPEDNVTDQKIRRIEKTAEIFLREKGFNDEYVQIDLLTVYFLNNEDREEKYLINYLPNINFV